MCNIGESGGVIMLSKGITKYWAVELVMGISRL